MGMNNFDRHVATEYGIMRTINGCHATMTQSLHHDIFAEGLSGHRSGPSCLSRITGLPIRHG
jgi:hypothetical protein